MIAKHAGRNRKTAHSYQHRRRVHIKLCTCHRLAPGVGPRANQGNMSGNTRG